MKKNILILIVITIFTANQSLVLSKVWQIGGQSEYKYCSEINNLVNDNDTIIIASGLYENDKQVTWTKNNLLIKGTNPKPNLKAGSLIANDNSNGKGIFVIRGNNSTIENIEFSNAKVQSRNGAGIRQEGSNLIVRDCIFTGNEMGILAGGTIPNCKILIEYCEFKNNGSIENPGYQHNIYINFIDTLVFIFNYTQNAIAAGHEFKSRAYNNFIMYNRISNTNSTDSRNIDLPNGGTALIIGNIIEQGQNSENSNIIGYGLEGLKNPSPHNLYVVNNTIVNRKSTGSFVHTAEGTEKLMLYNNVLVGAKTGGLIIGNPKELDSSNNYINDDINSPKFANLNEFDYTPSADSPLIDNAIIIKGPSDKLQTIAGYELNPMFEYTEPSKRNVNQDKIRNYDINRLDVGAIEFESINSIPEDIENHSLVYPNPATNKISFDLYNENICDLFIYDLNGNLFLNIKNYKSKDEIDVNNFKSGTYKVLMWNKMWNATQCFMVVK